MRGERRTRTDGVEACILLILRLLQHFYADPYPDAMAHVALCDGPGGPGKDLAHDASLSLVDLVLSVSAVPALVELVASGIIQLWEADDGLGEVVVVVSRVFVAETEGEEEA